MDRDLENDLKNSPVILEKVKDRRYAQNLYCALCNMRWQSDEVFDILKDEWWSVSWRYAGGLVAELRVDSAEDYMSWYCSGISGGLDSDLEGSLEKGYVSEGVVTDEIREDLADLGWHPTPWPAD